MPACPRHRGALAGARGTGHLEHWRNPNSQIVLIGKPRDWPEIQKDFEAPQIARPFCRTPTPPSVTLLASRGWAPGASANAPLCPPLSSSPRVSAIDPAPHPPPVLKVVAVHLVSSPSPPPNSLQRDPSRSLPAPPAGDPHVQNTHVTVSSPPLPCLRGGRVRLSSALNSLSPAMPSVWASSLTSCSQSQ